MSKQRARTRRRSCLAALITAVGMAGLPASAHATVLFAPNPNPVGADFLFRDTLAGPNNILITRSGNIEFRAEERNPNGPLLLATPPCALDANPRVVECAPLIGGAPPP